MVDYNTAAGHHCYYLFYLARPQNPLNERHPKIHKAIINIEKCKERVDVGRATESLPAIIRARDTAISIGFRAPVPPTDNNKKKFLNKRRCVIFFNFIINTHCVICWFERNVERISTGTAKKSVRDDWKRIFDSTKTYGQAFGKTVRGEIITK